ncbi:MFS transporter [Rhodopila sp.]|jgi:MFS family permease|uniref:MFS transporter n=1 Tax=Rhodopila sp. TaxID=2480087 RepID=UPI002B8E4518|nr:MFS transporter [Rhodopila sp.]HVZ09862.1 MFS transporter [Rhodopila sp.]
MQLPTALVPLRNGVFRHLWVATVIGWLGTWLQNTGAGWLMTSLAPNPVIVAAVQAATIMPVFLLALPGGALADIVDRRIFLTACQCWTFAAAALLAVLTITGSMTAWWLLALTFAIGIGNALVNPAWNAVIPELVPREDLVQAIALNGIGFNLTRAVGPALAGFLILVGGSGLTFSAYALAILAPIAALLFWQRNSRHFTGLPRENFLPAMRAGMRFVRNTPAIQSAMVRTMAYSIPASAPWALLPLFVRHDLQLGAGMYGLILGAMGIGGVTSGLLLPKVRGKLSRGGTVMACTTLSCIGMVIVGLSHHWLPTAGGMLLFGLGWTSAFATIQAAAQLVCPPWVRARALSIFQLAQNGALTVGSFAWGWIGDQIGLSQTFLASAAVGIVLMLLVRFFSIEAIVRAAPKPSEVIAPLPEAPAPEFVPILRHARGSVMEMAYYRVEGGQRTEFLRLMNEVHQLRGRTGATFWQLYSDVAHPEHWVEVWSMESWTEHLREVVRLSEDDKRLLAALTVFQHDVERPARLLAVNPQDHLAQAVERDHLRLAGAAYQVAEKRGHA